MSLYHQHLERRDAAGQEFKSSETQRGGETVPSCLISCPAVNNVTSPVWSAAAGVKRCYKFTGFKNKQILTGVEKSLVATQAHLQENNESQLKQGTIHRAPQSL